MSVVEVEFGGHLVGRYWVRWVGAEVAIFRTQRCQTQHKLSITPGLVVVEVRRFYGVNYRYAVRVPGHIGFFSLDQFEWHGNAD